MVSFVVDVVSKCFNSSTFLVLLRFEMSYDLAKQALVLTGQLLSRYLRHGGQRSSDLLDFVSAGKMWILRGNRG